MTDPYRTPTTPRPRPPSGPSPDARPYPEPHIRLKDERSGLSFKATAVLEAYAPHWRKASAASQGRLLAQLVWEIRWDGPRRRLSVTLDEVAIAHEHARQEGPDEPDESDEP